MSKYITHFQTESAYQAALPSIELPNVSLVDELGEVHYHRALYGAHAGDICLYDVAEGQKFFVTANDWNLTSYPTASYPIVGIAITDEGVSGVTLCSALAMAADGSTSTTEVTLKWQNTNFDWGLTKYNDSVPHEYDGKTNTATIINAIKAYDLAHSTDNLTGCIGGAIQVFAVTGTNAGDWYVGADGEVYNMVTNHTAINESITKIITADSSLGVLLPTSYSSLSSSEQNINNARYITYSNGNVSSLEKIRNFFSARPFLKLT